MHVIDFLYSLTTVEFKPAMFINAGYCHINRTIIMEGISKEERTVAVLILLVHELGHAWYGHSMSHSEMFGYGDMRGVYQREKEAWRWAVQTLRELDLLDKYRSFLCRDMRDALSSYRMFTTHSCYNDFAYEAQAVLFADEAQAVLQEARQVQVTEHI